MEGEGIQLLLQGGSLYVSHVSFFTMEYNITMCPSSFMGDMEVECLCGGVWEAMSYTSWRYIM